LLAASAGFVVDFGDHEADQLVQVVVRDGWDGVVVAARIRSTSRRY
jgi:hypothetical protein